eukprot:gnl/Hemi2/4674_TR1616_c0_g1_i1.p1 gnl/Hemi2/4674_TR1616_c0_g1~~gnl/Hemi2/4674_TR1616_c0_g1_i1.p1  ORF type:complete len:220 (-),score=90.26 gnl/Hemi2/4674_TR1616_c0_g1_i1:146-778(-)
MAGTKEGLLLEYVLANSERGNPESVLSAIDVFSRANWMMHIGDQKGLFLDNAVRTANPRTVLELGCYCGYSAVRTSRLLAEGSVLTSIDPNPVTNAIARQIVAHAGLSAKHQILEGTASSVLPSLQGKQFDLVFIDHEKSLYLSDLLVIENAGLLRSGSIVVADNVILFNLADYLAHVRDTRLYSSSTLHRGFVEYTTDQEDGVEVSVRA